MNNINFSPQTPPDINKQNLQDLFSPIQKDDKQNILVQSSEFDNAEIVFLHNPSNESQFFSFHPQGSLFEKPVNIIAADDAHQRFKKAIESKGVQTATLQTVIQREVDQGRKEQLLKIVAKFLEYKCYFDENLTSNQLHYLKEDYKVQVLSTYSVKELCQVLLTNPKVYLQPSSKNTCLETVKIEINPLGNMLFMRDHMITTAVGPIIGKMGSNQRQQETRLIKLMFELLNIKYYEIPSGDGYQMEGGDFVIWEDIAFIGVGLRTTKKAVYWILQQKLFGKKKIAVVFDTQDLNIQRMHLDTVFNIADEKLCILHEGIIGENPKYPRFVKEYIFDETTQEYVVSQQNIPFDKYLIQNNYKILPATEKQQEEYFINFLHLGRDKGIIAVHPELEKYLKQYGYKGKVDYVEFSGITAMYGAAHCCSQAFRQGSVFNEKQFDDIKQ